MLACREYDILVPFVCHRCGNCCRKYDPMVEMELLPEISRTLGRPIDAIEDRLHADSLAHSTGQPTDCCFLQPAHSGCVIYDVRPTACRQFPPLEGVGAGEVDCPGYREYQNVLKAFADRFRDVCQSPSASARRPRQIPRNLYRDVLQILSAIHVSDRYREVFEQMNGCSKRMIS